MEYFYTFNHSSREKSSKRAKVTNHTVWPLICQNKPLINPKWFNSLDANSKLHLKCYVGALKNSKWRKITIKLLKSKITYLEQIWIIFHGSSHFSLHCCVVLCNNFEMFHLMSGCRFSLQFEFKSSINLDQK